MRRAAYAQAGRFCVVELDKSHPAYSWRKRFALRVACLSGEWSDTMGRKLLTMIKGAVSKTGTYRAMMRDMRTVTNIEAMIDAKRGDTDENPGEG